VILVLGIEGIGWEMGMYPYSLGTISVRDMVIGRSVNGEDRDDL